MWPRRRETEIDSKVALQSAQEKLEQTLARAPDVKETSQRLRLFRERNHIAEQLASIMGGSK